MFSIEGKYETAIVFTDLCEPEAVSQILTLLNQPMAAGSHARFMPDVHAGKGCVVGTTMHILDKAVPNLVGVDIGCGMEVTYLAEKELDLEKLDKMLHEGVQVPSGFSVRNNVHPYIRYCRLEELHCKDVIKLSHAEHSLGSLGGGNHFIEIDKDQNGNYILVVHSGSRHLGVEVCNYYQNMAIRNKNDESQERAALIASLKEQGRQAEISEALAAFKSKKPHIPDELAYLEGEALEMYLHDMKIVQEFAMWSRKAMTDSILTYMGWAKAEGGFTTIHNYIDVEHRILRKGSISAMEGERVIIPLSMKEGSIIAVGKGSPEWNCSAPHGAGRLMSRSKAKEVLSVDDFTAEMAGIYTTCVGYSTLDESPMAYKPAEAIIENVKDTVDVIEVIKPVYNFKASD